jgi:hypothetical protein
MVKKKKRITVIDWVNMGIFPCVVMFSVGNTRDQICKYLKKIGADGWLRAIEDVPIDPGCWYGLKRDVENLRTKETTTYLFIIAPRFEFLDDDFVKLAHEILHVCQFYLPDVNVNRDKEIECEAYTHTHIMRQCLKILRGIK